MLDFNRKSSDHIESMYPLFVASEPSVSVAGLVQ